MKRYLIAIAPIVLVVALVIYLATPDPIEVRTVSASYGQVIATVANTKAGTVKACNRSKISMEIGGRVKSLNVQEGDKVVAGQVLLSLWNDDKNAAVEQARASSNALRLQQKSICIAAERDRRESNRIKRLVKDKLASEEQADSAESGALASAAACQAAKAEFEVANATLKLRQAQLQQTYLRAPFDGIVAEINGEIGEYITPSPPGVATPPAIDLIDHGCIYVSAPIDEIDASELSVGQAARITMDAFRGKVFEGRLTRIAPYVLDLEKQARTVSVDVQFLNVPGQLLLLPGYSADIEVITQTREKVLRIPTEAVLEGNKVLVLNPQTMTLEQRVITSTIRNWTYTGIDKGLDENEQVVISLENPAVIEGAEVILAP